MRVYMYNMVVRVYVCMCICVYVYMVCVCHRVASHAGSESISRENREGGHGSVRY